METIAPQFRVKATTLYPFATVPRRATDIGLNVNLVIKIGVVHRTFYHLIAVHLGMP